jgi:hypothetical protein
MGFIRRYGYFPGNEVITQIEGTIVIDLPPPGSIQGAGVGVACCVGEFADCSYATSVDASGVVSTNVKPIEIFSATDLTNKVGGFDETIGEFGISQGNGYEALRSKRFARLFVAPVNLASSNGCRYFRELPLCTTQTNANPIVPVTGATIGAGREFRASGAPLSRIRIAKRTQFTSLAPIATGVGGSIATAALAAVQTFAATAGFDWTTIVRPDGTLGARKGDILVIGNNNAGARQPLPSSGTVVGAGTYRVASDPTSGVNISLERLDGSSFQFVNAATTVPWRLHYGSDADSAPVLVPGSAAPGGYAAADVGGYTVPTRPLTDSAGAQTSGSYSAGLALAPVVAPTALTGSSWDPLSGLGGRIMPTGGLAFTVDVQGINRAANASLDAAYATAIDAMLAEDTSAIDINIVWSARKSQLIRAKLRSHVLDASTRGVGRIAVVAPSLAVQTTLGAVDDADPGVGATRNERVIYTWPGCQVSIPEAVNFRLRCATAETTLTGVLDQSFDGFMASLLSVLPPERNPGQAAAPVPQALAAVLGMQRGVSGMGVNEYTQLRVRGVAALRVDLRAGSTTIQSGITSSLTAGEKNINRRRMADFIEDSAAARLVQFAKLPPTQTLKDSAFGELDAFLSSLLSPNNRPAQRIAEYQLDDVSGNTPELEAQGIFVIIMRVRTLATADFIVLQAQIGENVQILPAVA